MPGAFNNRGKCHWPAGRAPGGHDDFDAAIGIRPDFHLAVFQPGRTGFFEQSRARGRPCRSRRPAPSLPDRPAARRGPDCAGHTVCACIWADNTLSKPARTSCEAPRLVPNDARASNNLAWLLAVCPVAESRVQPAAGAAVVQRRPASGQHGKRLPSWIRMPLPWPRTHSSKKPWIASSRPWPWRTRSSRRDFRAAARAVPGPGARSATRSPSNRDGTYLALIGSRQCFLLAASPSVLASAASLEHPCPDQTASSEDPRFMGARTGAPVRASPGLPSQRRASCRRLPPPRVLAARYWVLRSLSRQGTVAGARPRASGEHSRWNCSPHATSPS